MPSKLLAVAPKSETGVYPELLSPADKRVINNITLRIENEKFEGPRLQWWGDNICFENLVNKNGRINIIKFIRKYRRKYRRKRRKMKFIPKRRKTGKPSASNNLAGFLRTLKRRQNITQVSGKSIKDVSTSCQESAHQQELFRFCLSGSGVGNSFFWGLACLSPHHSEALVLFCGGCECYRCRIGEKGFSESDETRKNCFCLRVKN